MKTATKRKATETKARTASTRNAKKAANGKKKSNVTYLQPKVPFTKHAMDLRNELHRFDSIGQDHNRYAIVAMILCERQGQFEWKDWAGQRGAGIDQKRGTEISSFLEQNGYRKYDRSYVGKVWAAMLKATDPVTGITFVENASTAQKNGEALIIDASGLRNAIATGAVIISIAKDQNKKTLKDIEKARRSGGDKKKTVPTLPAMVTSQAAYRKAIKHLNAKIAKLQAKAKREGWKA